MNFYNPAGNYMFRVNKRNTRTRCEICIKLTIKTPERRQWPLTVNCFCKKAPLKYVWLGSEYASKTDVLYFIKILAMSFCFCLVRLIWKFIFVKRSYIHHFRKIHIFRVSFWSVASVDINIIITNRLPCCILLEFFEKTVEIEEFKGTVTQIMSL